MCLYVLWILIVPNLDLVKRPCTLLSYLAQMETALEFNECFKDLICQYSSMDMDYTIDFSELACFSLKSNSKN